MLNPELLQRGLATLNAIDGAQGEAAMTAPHSMRFAP